MYSAFPPALDRGEHGERGDERLPAGRGNAGDEVLALRDAGVDRLGLGRVQRLDAVGSQVLGQPVGHARDVRDVHYSRGSALPDLNCRTIFFAGGSPAATPSQKHG